MYLHATGSQFPGKPSLGSWVVYGLGSENQNLPAFVSMCPAGYPIQDVKVTLFDGSGAAVPPVE